MKPKQIIFLLAILVVLAALVFIKKSQKPKELATEVYTPLEISFDAAAVSAVTVSKKGKEAGQRDQVELKKEGEIWKSPSLWNARADAERVSQLVSALNGIKGELRAGDKSLFPDFGISDEEAVQIIFQDASANEILNVFVGTKKADNAYQFIRKNGSDQVYLTETPVFDRIGLYGDAAESELDKKFWAALFPLQIETDKITGIELKQYRDDKETLLAGVMKEADPADPAKKKWKFVRENVPFALDADQIQSFLGTLKDFKAQSVLDASAKDYGFTKPAFTLKLQREGADEWVVTVGGEDKEANAYYVNVTGEPVVFQVSKYYFENIKIDDSRFFAANPLELGDEKKIAKLTVSADKTKMDFSPKDKVWPALSEYINQLKQLKPSKLLLDPSDSVKVKTPSPFSIEIQKDGEAAPQIVDIGSVVSIESKDYAAILRNSNLAFTISESQYKTLFDNLARLEAPKDTPAAAAAPADTASQPQAA